MELVQQLKQDGIDKGLCRLWQRKFRSVMSVKDLAEMYIRGIDFCISEDYPTLDFLRENFKGECEQYGIFVDDHISSVISGDNLVFNGQCRAVVECKGYSITNIYARHSSTIIVNVSNNAVVIIDAFDDAKIVVAVAGSSAKVCVNLYGNSHIDSFGSGIKVINKNKLTY